MKEGVGNDFLAIAWEYPGQALEVIPARFSLIELTCHLIFNCGATLDTWTSISGSSIADFSGGTNDYTTPPSLSMRLTNLLEGPSNIDDNYGSRMKGWLVPPISGDYIFWIASDDHGEFWLSTNRNPATKILVCYQPWSDSRQWRKYPEQKSRPISLLAGKPYYYEVRFGMSMRVVCVCISITNDSC